MQAGWQEKVWDAVESLDVGITEIEAVAKDIGDDVHPEIMAAAIVAAFEARSSHGERLFRARTLCDFGTRFDRFASHVIEGGCQPGTLGQRAIQAGLDEDAFPDALQAVAAEYESTVISVMVSSVPQKERKKMRAALKKREVSDLVRDSSESGLFAGRTEQQTADGILRAMETALRRSRNRSTAAWPIML